MARPGARSLRPLLPIAGALAGPLDARARRAVTDDVRAWLGWQESLGGWRAPRSAVDAIPFVALYAQGELRGCMGSAEGEPGARLARAFLSSLADVRFGGVRPADRASLVAEVRFLRGPRLVDEARAVAELELGTHGVGLARPEGLPVLLLPSVARDSRLDARGMLDALHRKAGPAPGALFLFDTEAVVVRREAGPASTRPGKPRDLAAAWLASLVRRHGTVAFAIDARTGAAMDVGKMHHARSASVIHALAAHGRYGKKVAQSRARLAAEVRAALEGRDVEGWPTDPAEVAGTLALALRAGVDLREVACGYVRDQEAAIARAPWHAGQVVAALGISAPAGIWAACVADLVLHPWAPWTVLGFRARGEPASNAAKAVAGLVAAVRAAAPYRGAVVAAREAEVAITALTVEALLAYPELSGVSEAVDRARGFLASQQLLRTTTPAPFVTGGTEGAYVASPTSSLLRGDVTAHALLAT